MEGMWKPSRFAWIYPLAVTYTQSLTIPSAVTLYHYYGALTYPIQQRFAQAHSTTTRWSICAFEACCIACAVGAHCFQDPKLLLKLLASPRVPWR